MRGCECLNEPDLKMLTTSQNIQLYRENPLWKWKYEADTLLVVTVDLIEVLR